MTINPFLNDISPPVPSNDTETGVTPAVAQADETVKTQIVTSPGFAQWLAGTGGSLAITTYQSGRIFFLGTRPDGTLYAVHRLVGPAMGIALDAQKFWLGCRDQIWRFSNTGAGEIEGKSYDAIYMPRQSNMVGLSDTHDMVADVRFNGKQYDLLYANTRMSCIATPDSHYNFRPVWQPDFISELVPEDRCHLNGLAVVDGELVYVSLCATSNVPRGWKSQQTGGGFVIDLRSNTVVCDRLSMPHSPRWRDDAQGGKLWLLNSGEGEMGYIDFTAPTRTAAGRFVPVAQCAGFARGLAFVGNHAVVGLSRRREKSQGDPAGELSQDMSTEMPLRKLLEMRGTPARCGIEVFDLTNGAALHSLTIEGNITELYDVAFLPGFTRPFTPGFSLPEVQQQRMNWPVG